MNIDVKEYGNVTVLGVKGNLMGGPETVSIHDKVKELVQNDVLKIVIDLSKVKWMNSSGLGTMMGCLTSLKNADGELKLCGVAEKVKSLFMITKLITLFSTFDTVEDAVADFQK
ncbi:STAS domain-containing protein [bacterium]|nr:STAS domain-containing protein [bacterium]